MTLFSGEGTLQQIGKLWFCTFEFVVSCRRARDDDPVFQVGFCNCQFEEVSALPVDSAGDGLAPDQGLHVG